MEEFAQLLDYNVFHGLKASDLTEEQKKGAANMITIIEEKFNRGHTPENPVLKARNVFNGKVQKGLILQGGDYITYHCSRFVFLNKYY